MLTIGAFSRLSHISSRMLRYYDAMGLLRPAHVGAENGYRYYGEEQLATAARIRTLRGYGFPLAEIGALLDLPEGELTRRLHHRRLEAYGELDALRASLRRMEGALITMEGYDMLKERYHVIILEDPAQRVFSLRKTINVAETHALFQELDQALEEAGLKRAGVTQQILHGEEFSYESMDLEAQAVVDRDGPGVKTIPARKCAAVTHTGPYEDIKYAYDALCAWLGEHTEYQVTGPAVERYLKDEGMAKSAEELETAVLFPVARCP